MTPGGCSIDECENRTQARGLCNKHYLRLRKTGTTDDPQRYTPEQAAEAKRASSRLSAEKHRESRREQARAYYASNAEKERERRRRALAADPERVRAYSRKWRAANPDKQADSTRRWQQANAEKQRGVWAAKRSRRLALQNGTRLGRVDFTGILATHGMVCHLCTGPIDGMADLHFDHVVPLALGGPHVTENIKPAHAACNMKKGARLDAAPSRRPVAP